MFFSKRLITMQASLDSIKSKFLKPLLPGPKTLGKRDIQSLAQTNNS